MADVRISQMSTCLKSLMILSSAKSKTKEIYISHDSVSNVFSTTDYDHYKWERTGSATNFQERLIIINHERFGDMKCVEKGTDYFSLIIENEVIRFDKILIGGSGTSFHFQASKPNGRIVDVSIIDSKEDFSAFFKQLTEGDIIFPKQQAVWPIVFGAAVLVAALVDAYCDGQIAAAAANCAANCMGFSAEPCGGTCIEVCE